MTEFPRLNSAGVRGAREEGSRQLREITRRPPLCEGCGVNRADPPSKLCPGCQAYQEPQS